MEGDVTELVTHLAFQLTAILLAAKIGGEICERWLKIPPVIGELLAGVAIGPFALGQFAITSPFWSPVPPSPRLRRRGRYPGIDRALVFGPDRRHCPALHGRP